MRGVTLFDLMLSIANMLMLPQFIPLVLFLFIRKVPAWSALASMVAGFLPSVLNMALGWGWSYQEKSLAIVTCSSAVFFISMAFYRRISDDERERVEAFYENMTTPSITRRKWGKTAMCFNSVRLVCFPSCSAVSRCCCSLWTTR
jgi:Na+/proline symporter